MDDAQHAGSDDPSGRRSGTRPVQVWWARLSGAYPGLPGLLDPVERARYEATADPLNRQQFLVGCALSRLVLGRLLGLPPARVPLRRVCPRCGGPHGKAALDPAADLGFSISHSGPTVGLAVCRGAEVGLDVERLEEAPAVGLVAPRILSPAELAVLHTLVPADRPAALLRYWTRKEAVLKALGIGLGLPPSRLEVSAPGAPARVLRWEDRPDVAGELRLTDLEAEGRHPAAVCVTGGTEPAVVEQDAHALLTDAD
ncbi:4'-phosphopantetheinyl transferase superfamily protein [Streptomyces actinomycinicus]|uniref:4'-phosphopantetheinyl transferase superfamily protein n=1 Tax=Streptomyces actinomycinicus TaxID=1695166 RepID=A0A937EHC7_9ACTN|nr:4'-phosphopantetheinyl transferase superfamily protein [Streptomyces actinomycinicus]MBL1083118.1 4'-phosphopantetheinyl transferase superfamily protein [Streptomyces actinomycinicus]